MDSGGAFFLMAFVGMFVGTAVLGFYVFYLYRFGMRIGERAPLNRPMWMGIVGIALAWPPLCVWPYFTDWHIFMQIAISMAFYLLSAYPMAVGFGAAIEVRREQSKRRYRKNVDDWLGEWECEPAGHAADDDE